MSSPSINHSKPPQAPETDAFVSSTAALEAQLQSAPGDEVRPEVVERGRELLQSSAYPPLETVFKIASLLGENISE